MAKRVWTAALLGGATAGIMNAPVLPGGGSLRLHQATATTSRMRWMTRS